MKYGLLISGNLGFLMLEKLNSTQMINFVLTDNGSEAIISYCEKNQIPHFKGNPRKGKVSSFLEDKNCDYILSINYLFIIEKEVIELPSFFAINFHGSLLPKYRGRTPHVWAIINNETRTGITAHVIDEGCDTGDIIEQIEIEIAPNDTGAIVLTKFNENYWSIISSVISKIEVDQIVLTKQDDSIATIFSKRTPDDGKIDWNWQKERIRNWVRAQAMPYPGAFTFHEDQKLTIDKISYSNDGFTDNMPNGHVLSIHPLKIKTPNGVILVEEHRGNIDQIEINTVLT